MKDSGLGQGAFKQGNRSNLAVVLFTKLDVWVGRYLLAKQGDNAVVFESLREVAEHWVKEFCTKVPGATPDAFRAASGSGTLDLVNDAEGTPMKASAQAKAKAGAKKAKEVSLDLYEINSRGEITSALGRLLQAGFLWARPSP